MSIQGNGDLIIYALNVGQADTSLIITPKGHLVIIDVVQPVKVIDLLTKLGLQENDEIEELIITHPHIDHFRGVGSLLQKYKKIKSISLAPFWNQFGMGPPTYRAMLDQMYQAKTDIDFISGYSRMYPDGALSANQTGFIVDKEAFYIELLGPPNSLLSQLERDKKLDTNHLSIISGIHWNKFSMIFAGDAQMENWAHFDNEGMFSKKCKVLRSSHHGSGNGTQWERLDRLDPKCVIISSNPKSTHGLPDLVGTSIFSKYETKSGNKVVAVTDATKSIRITVKKSGSYRIEHFEDQHDEKIDLNRHHSLTWDNNATNWQALLEKRTQDLYH